MQLCQPLRFGTTLYINTEGDDNSQLKKRLFNDIESDMNMWGFIKAEPKKISVCQVALLTSVNKDSSMQHKIEELVTIRNFLLGKDFLEHAQYNVFTAIQKLNNMIKSVLIDKADYPDEISLELPFIKENQRQFRDAEKKAVWDSVLELTLWSAKLNNGSVSKEKKD